MGLIRELPKAFNPWVMLRSFSEVIAILCFITALGHMPIADLTAIAQISPLVVLLGMWLFFGEKAGGVRLALVGLGITGALMVAQPAGVAASPFAIFGFFTALGAALRDILSRKVPARTPALAVTFSTLFIVMVSAVVMSALFETQVAPTFRHGWLMFIAGFFLMCGHALVFMAYRMAPARVVAPFNYSFMIWAGLSGLIVFREVPNALAICGMLLIMAAGLAVVMLEGRTRQGAPAAVKG
jgi:drug/metabolite transporter (DMT)-like permease